MILYALQECLLLVMYLIGSSHVSVDVQRDVPYRIKT
jgi:hypothetical protein